MPDFQHESQYPAPVCGVDEAGRGPWAGPVVAAAVILRPDHLPPGLSGLDDSKRLTEVVRERLFRQLMRLADLGHCHIGIGQASVKEIDQFNILRANDLAMARAIGALSLAPQYALIDGNRVPPDLPCPAAALVKGDSLSLSVAAASVIAKVTRDQVMVDLDRQYPGYGFARHKGYGVAAHKAALEHLGPCPAHRTSFKPVARLLATITT